MNLAVAKELLPLVNDVDDLKALHVYAEDRLKVIRNDLDTNTDLNSILRLQGQIKELKRLLSIREEVLAETNKKTVAVQKLFGEVQQYGTTGF